MQCEFDLMVVTFLRTYLTINADITLHCEEFWVYCCDALKFIGNYMQHVKMMSYGPSYSHARSNHKS